MLYDMTLVAYAPDGARLGNLPSPLEVNVGAPFDDVSSLTFTYPVDAPGTELLVGPVELAVEFMDPANGAWFEPPNMRFLRLEWSSDLLEDVPVRKFTCPGYAWLMNKVVTQPPPASVKASNVEAAGIKLRTAKTNFEGAKVSLRTAMGLGAGSVMLSNYAPKAVNNGCWILTDKVPVAHRGVTVGSGADKRYEWVAQHGLTALAEQVIDTKTTMDASQGTLNAARGDKSLARVFRNATVGTIVGTLLAEAHNRGRLSGLSYTFGSGTDSAGKPWAKALSEYELAAGTPAFNVLDTLTAQGLCDWRMNGRRLEIYNPDTAMSADRTDQVTLINGLDIDDAPDKGTLANVVGEMLFTGDEGMNFKLSNVSAPTPWGVWEGSVSQSGVDNVATGKTLGRAALVAGSAEQVESTRSLVLSGERALLPFIHYDVGDHITAPGPDGAMMGMRVRQATITRNVHGILSGSVVLNDRFIEKSIRAAKKMAGVFGGSGVGGGGAVPAPPLANDNREPEPPKLLSAEPSAFVNEAGRVEGYVNLIWEHTGLATDGTLQDLARFHLRAKTGTQPWQAFGAPGPDSTQGDIGPLQVKDSRGNPMTWQVAVMVEAANGKFSSYSNIAAVQMVDDVEPPPVPAFAQSDVSTTLRTTAVRWNGKGMNGQAQVKMPPDFLSVNVYEATSETGPWKLVGAGEFAGLVYQSPDIMPLKPVWYCLTAVDRSGNESEQSAAYSVTPAQNVDLSEIYKELDAAKTQIKNAELLAMASGATLGDQLAINLELASKASKQITTSKTAPVVADGDGRPVGALWTQISASGSQVGFWRWDGDAWVTMPLDPLVVPTIQIGAGTAGQLDVTRLGATSANIDTAVIDKLWADVVRSRAITTDMLTVAGNNLVESPDFAETDSWGGGQSGPNSRWDTGTTFNGAPRAWMMTQQAGGSANMTMYAPVSNFIPVQAGESYRVSSWVRPNGAIPGVSNFSQRAYFYGADKTMLTSSENHQAGSTNASLPSNVWSEVGGLVTAPAGAVYMRPRFTAYVAVGTTPTDRLISLGYVKVASATDASLIVDGTILGKHLAVDSITSREIKALSVSAGHLAANTITGDKVNVGSVRAAVLTANSVTASILHGDAVNGKTIQGATIRTATTGRRTQIDSNGLRMWDGGGNLVLSQNASSGDISLRGDLSSRSFGGNQLWAGADMRNSGATGAAARAGIVFKSDASEYSPASVYRDGTWGAVMIDSPYSSTGSYNGQSTVSVSNHGIEMWASKQGAITGPTLSNSMMLALNADGTWWIGGGGTSAQADARIYWQSGNLKVRRNANHMLDLRSDRSTVLSTSKLDITGPLYATAKNFKITHPSKPGMDLYHGSTESPWAGIEYWGDAVLDDNGVADIALPDYFEALAKQERRAVFLTPKYEADLLMATDISGGHFIVNGTPGQHFSWLVKAERRGADFAVEQPALTEQEPHDN